MAGTGLRAAARRWVGGEVLKTWSETEPSRVKIAGGRERCRFINTLITRGGSTRLLRTSPETASTPPGAAPLLAARVRPGSATGASRGSFGRPPARSLVGPHVPGSAAHPWAPVADEKRVGMRCVSAGNALWGPRKPGRAVPAPCTPPFSWHGVSALLGATAAPSPPGMQTARRWRR